MNKIKVAVIYGGKSTEHDVSIISGSSVVNNLNKDKYDIYEIEISKDGKWYHNNELIDNVIDVLKNVDVAFPVLHGKYGEDGSIQGLFEMFDIKYVGCDILSSAIAIDKMYTKVLLDRAEINNSKYCAVKSINNKYIYVDKLFNEIEYNIDDLCKLLEDELKYPMFVKPSCGGSSIGINKAKNIDELKYAINEAFKYDDKILIEENTIGREVECAVMGNDVVLSSSLGEIVPDEDFYSYNSKYKNNKTDLVIPANIGEDLTKKVKETAIKAYKAISAKGLARVDFFVNTDTNMIYVNEINTLPGFTDISMYPKLWEHDGLKYSDLLDKLIENALK